MADMADKNTSTTRDDLEKVERTVYNEAVEPIQHQKLNLHFDQ